MSDVRGPGRLCPLVFARLLFSVVASVLLVCCAAVPVSAAAVTSAPAVSVAPAVAAVPVEPAAAVPADSAAAETEWGVRFTSPEGQIRHRIELDLQPGAVGTDSITLINRSDAELVVAVAPADAEYGADGAAVAIEGEATGAGNWVVAAHDEYRLAAQTEAAVEFTVEVPPGTAPGRYPVALTLTEVMEPVGENEVPVQRTISVIAHITVTGTELAMSHLTPDWRIGLAGATGVVALVLVIALLATVARRRMCPTRTDKVEPLA